MKKTILVVMLLTVAAVVAALPAAIGWLVHDRLAPTIADGFPGATTKWDRGWFRSGLEVEDQAFSARLDFRHASPGAGWLSVDGLVTLAEWAAAIDLNARLSLGGTLSASARTPELEVPGPVTWRYAAPNLTLTADRGGEARVTGAAERLLIFDDMGNRLALSPAGLEFVMQSAGVGTASARLELTAQRIGESQSRLSVSLESIDQAALAELLQALGELAGTEPGSAGAGLGVIGAASAWQQLVAGGLRINILELALDDHFALSGHWQPDSRNFALDGQGRRDTLLDWWSAILGLTGRVQPQQARAAARLGLLDLAEQGALQLDDDRVSVDLRELPQSGAAGD